MKKFALFLLLMTGCVVNPYTNRRKILITSEAQENQLGVQAYQEVLAKERISTDPREVDPVRRVGRRLEAVANKPDFGWEFNVIVNDKTRNAWCLPGGKIVFYTGIFPALHDEAGMASVMGHEIAHALLRHGGERMSSGMLVGAAGSLLGAALGNQSEKTKKRVMAAIGIGLNYGVLLPFSRSQESEADGLGLILMARAGYDPRQSVEVWRRMSEMGGDQPPEFMSYRSVPILEVHSQESTP